MSLKDNMKHTASDMRPTVGLLLMRLRDNYENALMSHLTEASASLGVNLVAFMGSEPDLGLVENEVLQLAFSESIAGVLISPTIMHHCGAVTMHKFFQRYASVPMVAGPLGIPDVPQVVADDYAGMYAVVEHLIVQHHCQRIVFIRGLFGQREAEERYRAYRDDDGAATPPKTGISDAGTALEKNPGGDRAGRCHATYRVGGTPFVWVFAGGCSTCAA